MDALVSNFVTYSTRSWRGLFSENHLLFEKLSNLLTETEMHGRRTPVFWRKSATITK